MRGGRAVELDERSRVLGNRSAVTNTRPPNELASSIFQSLTEANVSFDLWEGLREGRSDRETVKAMQPYAAFFTGTENALFDSFIVLLYALYETRKDTVSFNSLLQSLEGNAPEATLNNFRDRVKGLKRIWVKIGVLRNEAVGHQSLSSHPSQVFEKAAISPLQIREFLEESQRLLKDIALDCLGITIIFNVRCKSHLERLLTCVRSNNS